MKEIDKEFRKVILGLVSKNIHIEARCDALESMMEAMLHKPGQMTAEQFRTVIAQATAACLQSRLEKIESQNPALAAELDRRPSMPDLPDALL